MTTAILRDHQTKQLCKELTLQDTQFVDINSPSIGVGQIYFEKLDDNDYWISIRHGDNVTINASINGSLYRQEGFPKTPKYEMFNKELIKTFNDERLRIF